jgi:predicted flap endonuclease-1-like 5' DNA nuclease
MKYLIRLAFFAAGLTLGFILATKRNQEIRHTREQLAATQAQLDAMRDKSSSYRRVRLDDLTAIKGIGKVYQSELHDAGIVTYQQLAEAEPQELQRMLGIGDWQRPNVKSWIEQARHRTRRGHSR